MISIRVLALFIAAFALLASALIAVPFDGTAVPSTGEALGANDVSTAAAVSRVGAAPKDIGNLSGPARALDTPGQSLPATEADETSVPRLWLGSPMVR